MPGHTHQTAAAGQCMGGSVALDQFKPLDVSADNHEQARLENNRGPESTSGLAIPRTRSCSSSGDLRRDSPGSGGGLVGNRRPMVQYQRVAKFGVHTARSPSPRKRTGSAHRPTVTVLAIPLVRVRNREARHGLTPKPGGPCYSMAPVSPSRLCLGRGSDPPHQGSMQRSRQRTSTG